MKRIGIILCLCIICIIGLFSTACTTNNEEITIEKFENYTSVYKRKIQSIDESLIINESSLAAQNEDYIKVYSIETSEHTCFGVRLTAISPKKAKLLIAFDDADEYWNADHITLFTYFISELSNCKLQFDEINAACNHMCQSDDNYRFNKNARLFWDDYHATLYYEEKLTIDMNS